MGMETILNCKMTEESARQHDESVDKIVEETGFEWNHACCYMYSGGKEVFCKQCDKEKLCLSVKEG